MELEELLGVNETDAAEWVDSMNEDAEEVDRWVLELERTDELDWVEVVGFTLLDARVPGCELTSVTDAEGGAEPAATGAVEDGTAAELVRPQAA